MKHLKTCLFLALTLISAPIFALESQSSVKHPVFTLDPSKNLECAINIPKKFSKYNDLSQGNTNFFVEYIQEEDDWDHWTEIFNVMQASFEVRPSLKEFLSSIEEQTRTRHPKDLFECKTMLTKEHTFPIGILSVEISAVIVNTAHFKDGTSGELAKKKIPKMNEFILTKVVEGTNSLIMIQYSKRFPTEISSAEKSTIKEKMLKVLEECTVVTRLDVPKKVL